ncbi:MAG: BON domain-containing protein, partial [Gemmataceae bacterium]|nr:BON domain-containing protein [Gemmataceae bacterium]
MRTWLMILGLAMLPGSAEAAEPMRPPDGPLAMLRDLRLTIQARRALQSDRVLSNLNLGVEVRGGVAVAWGPVPDDAAAQRAVSRLESLPGIVDVRTEFHSARLDRAKEPAFRVAKVELPSPETAKPAPPAKPAPVPVVP